MDRRRFAMHQGVTEGYLDWVKQLMEGGVSVNRTPLQLAAQEGLLTDLELLISSKCDLNLKFHDDGYTPVMLAAMQGNSSVVDRLLQHGVQVDCAGHDGWTLLHYVSRNGWTDQVRRILDRGEANLNAAARCGSTPLMWDAIRGHEVVAALLLRAGADVHQRDEQKSTVLHFAALHGRTEVVRLLLKEKGLDLNPQNKDGETPLHDSCFWGWGRRREVIEQLLVAGSNTNLKNYRGETALSVGIRRNELTLEEIKLFVQHGAFLQDCDYAWISKNPLKESVLTDASLCTQSIVNKFHHQSLPALKSISYFARKLPNIDKFELKARQIDEVRNLVQWEIQRNTFCNVVKAHPMALSALCVLSLISQA